MDNQEQVKLTSNAKRGMKLNGIDGIEHRNVAFNPYRAAFNYNVEIDYSSQQIVPFGPMNVACQCCKAFKFKNELVDCVARAVKSN